MSHSSRGVCVSQTIAKVYFSKIQNENNGKKIVKRFSHMTVLLLDRSRTKSFSICVYIYYNKTLCENDDKGSKDPG